MKKKEKKLCEERTNANVKFTNFKCFTSTKYTAR